MDRIIQPAIFLLFIFITKPLFSHIKILGAALGSENSYFKPKSIFYNTLVMLIQPRE